jgi:hypothetical protein
MLAHALPPFGFDCEADELSARAADPACGMIMQSASAHHRLEIRDTST